MENVYQVLSCMQASIQVPKTHHNKFGNFYYRKCEDILEEIKKYCPGGACVSINDEIFVTGDRVYVKATASLHYKGQIVSSSAFAREPMEKKGCDAAQITGASSSYARKYALGGLFLIDDSADPDTQDNSYTDQKPPVVVGKADPVASVEKVSKGQLERILGLAEKLKVSDETREKWLAYFKVSKLTELSAKDAKILTDKLSDMFSKLEVDCE